MARHDQHPRPRPVHPPLRKTFEPDPAQPRHFLTIRDAGYRFVAKPEGEENEEPEMDADEDE